MLAGLVQAPTYYNPFENYSGAKARQKTVLDVSYEQGKWSSSLTAMLYSGMDTRYFTALLII